VVYALPPETYNFDIIYDGEEDIELAFNDTDGAVFTASKENQLLAAYEEEMFAIRSLIGDKYRNGYEEVEDLFKTLSDLQNVFENEAQGTIALNFIKANRVYIPEENEDLKTYVANTKTTYFDYVEFNNETLQTSNFLFEYTFNYIKSFVGADENVPEAYEKNIDTVYGLLQPCDANFQKVLLHHLWQKFVDIDQVQTANYIAEKYLIPVSTRVLDIELVEKLVLFKNLSLGEKAPDFSWEADVDGKTVSNSLHKIDLAKKYVIVFWSSQCSHCLKEVPQIHSKIKALEKGEVKVIAIGLEDEPYDWQNTIYDLPEFINVLGLGKWENKIGDDYGIDSTPTYFVLDKDKKIIAKPEDIEGLLKIIVPSN
jgi:thiol-disulfide isomerase/thioredoxin